MSGDAEHTAENGARRLRRAAAVRLTFICMSGFVVSVVVAAGWGVFPALAVMFMTCLSAGMTASACSLYAEITRVIPPGSGDQA